MNTAFQCVKHRHICSAWTFILQNMHRNCNNHGETILNNEIHLITVLFTKCWNVFRSFHHQHFCYALEPTCAVNIIETNKTHRPNVFDSKHFEENSLYRIMFALLPSSNDRRLQLLRMFLFDIRTMSSIYPMLHAIVMAFGRSACNYKG